jgi:hypothetical protein
MAATLDIGDTDSAALVKDLERAFDIQISKDAAAQLETLGDVNDLILLRFRENSPAGEACANAVAFHRLKRAIREGSDGGANLTPSTSLAEVAGPSVKQFLITTEKRSGLPLPRKSRTWLGNLGIGVAILGFIGPIPGAVLLGGWTILGIPLMIGAGGFLMNMDPGKFPDDCQTLGDLSKRATRLGFSQVTKPGTRTAEREIWEVLTTIVAQYSKTPAAQMKPSALLLGSRSEGS